MTSVMVTGERLGSVGLCRRVLSWHAKGVHPHRLWSGKTTREVGASAPSLAGDHPVVVSDLQRSVGFEQSAALAVVHAFTATLTADAECGVASQR